MRHRTTPRFWGRYWSLPNDVRELADKNFRLLQRNPRHPSLQFKKVGTLWIGTHDEYERMIQGR
jgi:hypothetical protein